MSLPLTTSTRTTPMPPTWPRVGSIVAVALLAFLATACEESSASIAASTGARGTDARGTATTPTEARQPAPTRPTPPAPAGRGEPVRIGPVQLSKQHVDFGIVGPNTLVEAEIQITNITGAPLTITDAVPTCQCTTVDMRGTVIPPGGTVPMPMALRTSGSTGVRQAAVTLVFEGHPTPVQVSIQSEVAYSVRATPPFIDIQQAPRDRTGNVGPARPLRGTVTLESVDGLPFRILGVHGRPPEFVDFDATRDQPRSSYTIVYDLEAAHRNDAVPHYLAIETDRADCPVVELRVRHEATHLRPQFKIAEFRSTVGLLKPGEVGNFELEIQEFGNRRIANIASKDPSTAVVRLVDQKSDGKSLLITVEVLPTPSVRGLLYFVATITAVDGATADLVVFGRIAE